jgi:hypothetical protein
MDNKMRIKSSTLCRIIREEASRALYEDAGNPNMGQITATPPTASQAKVLKSLTDIQVAVKKIPDVTNSGTPWVKNCIFAMDNAVKSFTKNQRDKNFAAAVFESIGPNEKDTNQALLATLAAISKAAKQVQPGQFKQVIFGAQFNPDMEQRFLDAIKSVDPVAFIIAVKAWCQEIKIAPVDPVTAPVATPTTAQKSAAPPIQDWKGYVAKTPNGGAAVQAAWEANSRVTGQNAGFAAFVTWWRGMQKSRGQAWKSDPASVAAQLNADTKLKTPATAKPSAPAGVPGQAVAAESFKRVINILNENNHCQLKNLKITWGK